MVEEHTLYHGTSWEVAQIIKREGFKPSVGGCLGAGTYVARADKASRFAATCSRHGGDAGAVVEVRITFARAKYVRYNDSTWQAEGFDACRAERTSASEHPEWCLKSPSQVVVKEIRKVHCGVDRPAFEGEALSLGGVRHLASRAELSEVYFSEQDAVVSFAADAHAPRSARLHVYFQTGTVCCAFEHPRQGPMHAVRRKVDSNALELLFREARASSSGSCSCHGPPTGAKRSASGACHCNDRAKKPRHDMPGADTIACPELAGEWRPAHPSLWTRPHQGQHPGTVERWETSGRCKYQTELQGGEIVVTSKYVDPLTGLLEYKCKGVSGSACRAPQLLLRWNPDGTRSWDLGAWGVEYWQKVKDAGGEAHSAPPSAHVERPIHFRWAAFSARDKAVTGMPVVWCEPKTAHAEIANAAQLVGKMVVVQRGECSFQVKTERLAEAGAQAHLLDSLRWSTCLGCTLVGLVH